MNLEKLSIRLLEKEKDTLKLIAELEDKTLSQIVRDAIQQYISNKSDFPVDQIAEIAKKDFKRAEELVNLLFKNPYWRDTGERNTADIQITNRYGVLSFMEKFNHENGDFMTDDFMTDYFGDEFLRSTQPYDRRKNE